MTELATKYHALNDDLLARIGSLNMAIEKYEAHIKQLEARLGEKVAL